MILRMLAVLCAALLLPLTACDNILQYDDFDANREAIVDVVTEISLPAEGVSADNRYYAVAADGRVRETEAFEPESVVVYEGGSGQADETVAGILRQFGKLEHEVYFCEIFEAGGEYFPYAELNVNWWSPCVLYRYDREADALVELNTWDGERVVGLRVRDLDAPGA